MKRIMRSQLETGVPYMFYRDEVNRTNANKHEGMIYSSESLYRNHSKYERDNSLNRVTLEDDIDCHASKPGDFVVCNLIFH